MCVSEDYHGRVFVSVEALCALSRVEGISHWTEHGVAVSCLGDSFSVVKVLLDSPAKLHFRNGVGIEASVPRLVQSLALGDFNVMSLKANAIRDLSVDLRGVVLPELFWAHSLRRKPQ